MGGSLCVQSAGQETAQNGCHKCEGGVLGGSRVLISRVIIMAAILLTLVRVLI